MILKTNEILNRKAHYNHVFAAAESHFAQMRDSQKYKSDNKSKHKSGIY